MLTYGDWLRDLYGYKVQKLSVNSGNSCPNRDGSIGKGGCAYCINSSFSPDYTLKIKSITDQINEGKRFFGQKYPEMRYLAYFQTYTSTHNSVTAFLAQLEEALSVDGVVGAVIGTRPDCMPDELLDMLADINAHRAPIIIEYGAESSHNRTLQLINRCHKWEDTVDAVKRTAARGIHVGLHFIMGLPEESREDMLATIDAINELPVHTVKFHQLQLLQGAPLTKKVQRGEMSVINFSLDDYIDLCADITRRLRPDILIERYVSQAPASMIVSPKWGIKNHEFMAKLRKRLQQ